MMYATPYELLKSQIQSQYRNTNLAELIQGIIDVKIKYVANAARSLYNDNFSLSSAKDVGLDLWGLLLHFNRHVPNEADPTKQNYFNFNKKNFYRLNFYNVDKPNYARLDDVYYRRLLLCMYQSYFVNASVPKVNEFARVSLSDFGNVVVRDTADMSYIIYVFDNELPKWLMFIFSRYDNILPRPAGVGFKIVERVIRRFGFGPERTQNPEWFDKHISAFYNSNFYYEE